MTGRRVPDLLTSARAAALIPDNATIAISGSGGGLLEASEIFRALRSRFDDESAPQGLTLVHSLGIGHPDGRGLELWADATMVRRVIGGHWAWSPTFQRLVADERIEAYAWPAGVISQLLREVGAGRPGLFTRTGLHTFVDPRHAGGRCNATTTDELVDLVEVDGREVLHFRPLPIDVAVIRGTFVDERGNLSCAEEPASLDVLAAARAARASGGLVIAQAREEIPRRRLDPRLIDVPGCLIDVVVLAPEQHQTYASVRDLSYAGIPNGQPARAHERPDEPRDDATSSATPGGTPDTQPLPPKRQLVAGRAALEVVPGEVVNVGFGMASDVVAVLDQRGTLADVELLIEQGAIGGTPVAGELFGVSRDFDALLSSPDQFDLFGSGVLDKAFLGMAEVDAQGSVNVSLLAGSLIGPGGFIDISQHAAHVVFCGTFTTRGLELHIDDNGLRITQEGSVRKFVDAVSQVTYSGPFARQEGRQATYVTERCVFVGRPDGLELTEVVEGVDIERDILAHMDFEPIVGAPRVVSVEDYGLSRLADLAQ